MLCGLLNLLSAQLLRSSSLVAREQPEHSLFRDALAFISRNYRQDITLKDMARHLGYHEKYLSAALHGLTGTNFRTFLASYRIDMARQLLRSQAGRGLRMSDIAQRSGFSSINSFNRAFLRLTGTTPTQYRNSENKPAAK